jgi:hypothetical protein
MTPYETFAEILNEDAGKTFRDEWIGFANWESLRYFHDDPSSSSKSAIQWVLGLNELCTRIENDYQGHGKKRCLQALESAFVAFSRLELSDELCEAVQKWRDYRIHEKRSEDKPATIGEDLLKQEERGDNPGKR